MHEINEDGGRKRTGGCTVKRVKKNKPANTIGFLYRPGTGFLYGIHPFMKFFFVISVSVTVLLVNQVLTLALIFFLLCAIIKANKISIMAGLRFLRWVLAFSLSVIPLDVLVNFVPSAGDQVLALLIPPFFPVRRLTLFIAARNFFWIGSFSLSSAALTFTTRPRDFVGGLSVAGIPYRAVFAISLGLRYIPVIQSEASSVAVAQRIRGCSRSNIKSVRAALDFMKDRVKAVLISMFRHAFHASISMEKRAFTAYKKRTPVSSIPIKKSDIVFVVVVLILEFAVVSYAMGLLPFLRPISLLEALFSR